MASARRSGVQIRKYLRGIHAKSLSKRFKQIEITNPPTGRITASAEQIARRGKLFLASFRDEQPTSRTRIVLGKTDFESSVGLNLRFDGTHLATAKLGFLRGCVVIEAIQGKTDYDSQIKELNRDLNEPWPNFLLRKIEEHARGTGYRYAALRAPEGLYWYKKPGIGFSFIQESELNKMREAARKRIDLFARRSTKGSAELTAQELEVIANNFELDTGIQRKKGRIVGEVDEETWDSFETQLLLEMQREHLRRRIKHFYYRIAKANGYHKQGPFFVKAL